MAESGLNLKVAPKMINILSLSQKECCIRQTDQELIKNMFSFEEIQKVKEFIDIQYLTEKQLEIL